MKIKQHCCGIIVAAGSSTRMALDISKQFIPICGMPAIVRTLMAFDTSEKIDSIVVVCRKDDINQMEDCVQKYHIHKVMKITEGGKTRQASVAAGIEAAPLQTDYYAIHDGARSLITPKEIDSVIADAVRYCASALAVPVKDTVKVVNEDGFVVSTPERSTLWAVQTPQVFQREIYLTAMERAARDGGDYTDDCQLAEHAGIQVHLTRGEYTNIKLTTREDVALCETILKQREESI